MRDPLTIPAGTLRHSVTVEQKTPATNPYSATPTWNAVLTTRASIRTLTLSERSSAAGFVSEATHRITLRYQADTPLVEGMRVVFGTRTYLLQAVENVLERNRVITCLALEQGTTQ